MLRRERPLRRNAMVAPCRMCQDRPSTKIKALEHNFLHVLFSLSSFFFMWSLSSHQATELLATSHQVCPASHILGYIAVSAKLGQLSWKLKLKAFGPNLKRRKHEKKGCV